ncbi:hypothetical protein FRB93_008817 [Tulasnella sp. JGI-2019a]|nr:hypothetical protein FRB93_008817 [Tulasnella sp. JGI-2019a]
MEENGTDTRASSPTSAHMTTPKDELGPTNPDLAPTELSQHPRWSKLDTVSLQVEKTLYEVPMHLLMDSQYFRERLGSGRIVIEDVTVYEMDSLLSILDARVVESGALTGLSYTHWASVLRLATLWGFNVARSLAMEKFNTHFLDRDPLERLELALRCRVGQWVHPIYIRLCERPEGLSTNEIERLGVARFAAITGIREQVLRAKIPNSALDSSSKSMLGLTGGKSGICSGCGEQLQKVWVHKGQGHPPVADTCPSIHRGGSAPAASPTTNTVDIPALVSAAVELRVPF